MKTAALALLPVAAALVFPSPAQDGAALPWRLRDGGWRTDRVWYDGQAEKCVYDATRTIYGVERRYLATAYTNKQHMDAGTTTKSADGTGVEVFKHHWSERVPTENYDYDFSTASFVRTDDLGPFKLTAATQEDCGASFKQIWRAGRRLAWLESVYFPGAGLREGKIGRLDVCFEDALPLVLRDYPFKEGAEGKGGGRRRLRVVPSQKSTHSVPFEPVTMELAPRGPETLELPVGSVEAFRLDLLEQGGERPRASYWFALDGLHPLVRYEGPEGVTYRLRSLERTAYWERDS